MNREIKFRVWCKSSDRFELDNKMCFFIMGNLCNPEEINNENYVIQQYTGLKDKNGKEVYEGDIVVEQHDGNEGETIGKVFFAAGTFMIDGDGPLYEHVYSLTPDILEDYIVVGNIFENPELIKIEI